MKLKFFEKNEIEESKDGIVTTTNDTLNSNTNDIGEVRKKDGNIYNSAESPVRFRNVDKNLALTNFSRDGESFTAPFKKIDVQRGEPLKTSLSEAPSSTKSITTSFSGTAITPPRRLSSDDNSGVLSESDVQVGGIEYFPSFSIEFSDDSEISGITNSFMSGYNNEKHYTNFRNLAISGSQPVSNGLIFDSSNGNLIETNFDSLQGQKVQIPDSISSKIGRLVQPISFNFRLGDNSFNDAVVPVPESHGGGIARIIEPQVQVSNNIFVSNLTGHRLEPFFILRSTSAYAFRTGSFSFNAESGIEIFWIYRNLGHATFNFNFSDLSSRSSLRLQNKMKVFNSDMEYINLNQSFETSDSFLNIDGKQDGFITHFGRCEDGEKFDIRNHTEVDVRYYFFRLSNTNLDIHRKGSLAFGRPYHYLQGAPENLGDIFTFSPKTNNAVRYDFQEARLTQGKSRADFLITKQETEGLNTEDPDQDECEIDDLTGRIDFTNPDNSFARFSQGEFVSDRYLVIENDGSSHTISFSTSGTSRDLFSFRDTDKVKIVNSPQFYNLIKRRDLEFADWIEIEDRANSFYDLSLSDLEKRLNYVRQRMRDRGRSFRFIKSTGDFAFEILNESSVDETIISELNDREFPFVNINDITYNDATNKLILTLDRSSDCAPVPNKEFFDSIRINNRTFNFQSSSYIAFRDAEDENNPYQKRVAEYQWSTNLNPASSCGVSYPIVFRKDGTSNTSDFSVSREISKSTVRTRKENIFPEILGGFNFQSIEYTDTSLRITFNESIMNEDSFYSIAIKSKDGSEFITRELLPSDATITGGGVFLWEDDYPEFKEIKDNKDYTIEMKKGVTSTELKFFNTNPSGDYYFLKNIEYTDDSFSFELDSNGSRDVSSSIPFINLRLNDKEASPNNFIPESLLAGFERDGNKFTIDGIDLSSLTEKNYELRFNIQDSTPFQIQFTKLTDFCFDNIVILDTNMDDINVLNILNESLIHSSDKDVFKEVTEDGRRHILISLKNPLVLSDLKLVNRRIVGTNRKVGQIFLLKSIGTMSQFPNVKTLVNTAKREYVSQLNLSHIKSLPESIDYDLEFPPLDNQSDVELAQDIFSRVSNYNEFIVWVSGGEVEDYKIKSVKGFKFSDLVKGICLNDFEIKYVDGRITSGINFIMNIRQVL